MNFGRTSEQAKSGLGALTLTGANSYTGFTTVNAGVLALTTGGTIAGAASKRDRR